MYTLLPAPMRNLVLISFGGFLLVLWGLVEDFGLSWSAFRTTSAAASAFILFIWLAFGTVWYWSPWRALWRCCPLLNSAVYPDLNGVWVGTTQSNWPLIARVREAAASNEKLQEEELASIECQTDGIALQIEATLIGLRITGSTSSTDGRSHSITAKAVRGDLSGEIILTYIYQQVTPKPSPTDESVHMGAAVIHFFGNDKDAAEGEYWTRRKWQEGMNTAGMIVISRESERFCSQEKNLRDFARQAS